MIRILTVMSAIVASLVMMAAAQAATLTDIKGDIQVNQGDGFVSVSEAVTVNPGDKIMAGPEASAKVTYSNGVAWMLKSGRIMTVSSAKMAKIRSSAMLQEGGVVAAAAEFPWVPVLIGVGVVGGAIAVIASQDDDKKTSP